MASQKSWMTDTGNIMLGIGSVLAGSTAAMPAAEYRDWLVFAGIVVAGIGQVLANKGIRRRLPKG